MVGFVVFLAIIFGKLCILMFFAEFDGSILKSLLALITTAKMVFYQFAVAKLLYF